MRFARTILAIAAVAGFGLTPDRAAAETSAACFEVPEPIVSLSYGSRYTDDSKDRSDIDKEADAAVDAALEPIDDLIVDLAKGANTAVEENDADAANCVVDAIAQWADANAMSELETMNAQLSSPARVGGFALAYLQAAPVATNLDEDRRQTIEDWLSERMEESAQWFDSSDAPPKASRNNLRAWAGLAAAAVSEITGDEELRTWAADTVRLVACQADEDGALPLEMGRGPRALHYQLHATAPLVTAAALLMEEGENVFENCDGAIHRIVKFVPRAFDEPELANEKAGEPQLYFTSDDELKSYELAWAEVYLSRFDAPALEKFVSEFRPLANSKLGGSQSTLWQRTEDGKLAWQDADGRSSPSETGDESGGDR
ncbi:alginate lyase family protein [Roseibium salinum]|uniref:Alginate lyase family protein n=1 Tax=Roseibium salinum TaxID=1604349 RepID=A0ABT3QWM3_9HYPH|nr:alginate lyase family protein [Roseibium sp. DSM 29163]MCX2721339.1 alginate lyase family protein [Roseibium sp. DSM 29163]